MSIRPWLVSASVFVLFGVNGYLLYQEEIAPSEQEARHLSDRADKLLDLRYTSSERAKNFERMGLDKDQVKKAIKQIRNTEDRAGEKLDLLLTSASDMNELTDALCGQTFQVRPRYGALRFFVEESRGQRDPIDIRRVSELERQEWTRKSPITQVYAEVELGDDRKDDATRMALAAILSKKEQDVLERHEPWGRGLLPGAWSWDKVVQQNPGIEKRLIEYLVMMHLAVEKATGDGGVCGQEGE